MEACLAMAGDASKPLDCRLDALKELLRLVRELESPAEAWDALLPQGASAGNWRLTLLSLVRDALCPPVQRHACECLAELLSRTRLKQWLRPPAPRKPHGAASRSERMRYGAEHTLQCLQDVLFASRQSADKELCQSVMRALAALLKNAGHFLEVPRALLQGIVDESLQSADLSCAVALFSDPSPSLKDNVTDIAKELAAIAPDNVSATRLLTMAAGLYPSSNALLQHAILEVFSPQAWHPSSPPEVKQASLELAFGLSKFSKHLSLWPLVLTQCILPSLSNAQLFPPPYHAGLSTGDFELLSKDEQMFAFAQGLLALGDYASLHALILAPKARANPPVCDLLAKGLMLNLTRPAACAAAAADLCARPGVLFDSSHLPAAHLSSKLARELVLTAACSLLHRKSDADANSAAEAAPAEAATLCPLLRIVGFLWNEIPQDLQSGLRAELFQFASDTAGSPKVRWTAWNALSLAQHPGLCQVALTVLQTDSNYKARASCVGALLCQTLNAEDKKLLAPIVERCLATESTTADTSTTATVEKNTGEEQEQRQKLIDRLVLLKDKFIV